MAIDLTRSLREDLLYRMRWDLSGAMEDIEIVTGSYDQTVNMAFLGHPLADESIFDSPLSCIEQITIRDFADLEDMQIYYPKEERYQPPAALKINNENGSPITLRQFVTELHAYVDRNLEEIKRIKGVTYGEPVTHADGTQGRIITAGRPVKLPDDIRIFFNRGMPCDRDGSVHIIVSLFAEGERFWPNGFWAPRLTMIRVYEAQR
jgi:hypothetical protein